MSSSIKKLLFVDDEPNILEVLSRMLGQCGEAWEGTYRLGADEALEAMSHLDFDVVVTDFRMPKKDGLALIAAMRADSRLRTIPVIVLTGEADRTLKRRVLEIGAVDLLNKPVGREDLIARLRSAIRLKEYQDQLQDQVGVLDGLVRERTIQLEQSRREVVWRLAKAGEFRDDETGDHVARVAWSACLLADAMGMEQDAVELIFQTSPLHDLGKIGIPDRILLKEGPLTPEERAIIQQHAEIGEQILKHAPKAIASLPRMNVLPTLHVDNGCPSELIALAAIIARSHHEKWDGSGYPDGLAGTDIPIEARIVALADVYDALRSKRPYKAAMSRSKALAIVREERGRHFDPKVVDTFHGVEDRIAGIYEEIGGDVAMLPGSEVIREKNSVRG